MSVRRNPWRPAALALCLFVAACSGAPLLSVNTDLVRFLEQKAALENPQKLFRGEDAKSANDRKAVHLAYIEGELTRLADGAYAAATEATDAKAKISYYRVAATAAWQGRNASVVRYASEGSAVCAGSDGFGIAPRDCAMLLIIPYFAVSDDVAVRAREMESEAMNPGFAGGLPGKYKEDVRHLVSAYVSLGQAQSDVAANRSVPPDLLNVMQSRRAQIGEGVKRLSRNLIQFMSGANPNDRPDMQGICRDIQERAAALLIDRCARLLRT